ncbi:MAG TPA: 23S rRNA (pseudouridine(1915)-N(3))-methyltransferase RlmH [Burkholderiaceae bacterium]|nr:23S rRNA (pseudouridine(1915)-N(3))-methyltransferase RlmH [Burkholderiaceae bacterium]
MKLWLVAVGQRQPAWADAAFDDFAKRLPAECRLESKTVKAEPRTGGRAVEAMMAAEAARLEAAIQSVAKGARRVVLDERGERRTTAQLAERLRFWLGDGRDVALIVGGPDGLDPRLKASADETLRLSDLTLPHALARVLLAEALYRAWSVTVGHPYHRA